MTASHRPGSNKQTEDQQNPVKIMHYPKGTLWINCRIPPEQFV